MAVLALSFSLANDGSCCESLPTGIQIRAVSSPADQFRCNEPLPSIITHTIHAGCGGDDGGIGNVRSCNSAWYVVQRLEQDVPRGFAPVALHNLKKKRLKSRNEKQKCYNRGVNQENGKTGLS